MKYLFSFLVVFFLSFGVHANPIDDSCPQFTYDSAPIAEADQYLCRSEYAVAYSYKHKNPVYTTEHYLASHTGNLPRSNDFRADSDIPVEYQSTLKDYLHSQCNGGRCDRGHMTPDQNFSADQKAVSESFLMSNMVPQNYQNNEIIWKKLETQFRHYALNKPQGIYIITGPAYSTENPKSIGNGVSVPDMLFKVAIDPELKKSIAFYMPNVNLDSKTLRNYVVNLDTIEKATGIKFAESLDKITVANYDEWK
ncbi:DNA/RNA non-specific endonuclease [Ralstonia phage RP13]|nr:DNA/RNA non-specific endonuclease [Ralstonia phage RP13]